MLLQVLEGATAVGLACLICQLGSQGARALSLPGAVIPVVTGQQTPILLAHSAPSKTASNPFDLPVAKSEGHLLGPHSSKAAVLPAAQGDCRGACMQSHRADVISRTAPGNAKAMSCSFVERVLQMLYRKTLGGADLHAIGTSCVCNLHLGVHASAWQHEGSLFGHGHPTSRGLLVSSIAVHGLLLSFDVQ